jgi:trigger factor
MKKTIKKLPKSRIEIEFEIPAEELEEFLNEAAKELSNSLRVQGFRTGNIPRNIVERELGVGKVMERGIELAVRKSYLEAVADEKIEAIGSPKITVSKAASGNPLVFKTEVDILPEVDLADYVSITKEKKPTKEEDIKVEEKELKESLDWLLKSRAKYIAVLRGAKEGDRLEIDFSVSMDGEKIENGEGKNYPLVLGQSKFIKGFDDQLVGVKEGEEKKFSLVFPDDYHEKKLAGKPADFVVKIHSVQEQELPELNDEFAKSLGGFENLAGLKESVEHGIKHEKMDKEKNDWRQNVLSKIAEKSKMEIPEILIENEADKMMSEIRANVESFGLPWEKYLNELSASEMKGKKLEEIEVELRAKVLPQAEKRVREALVLRWIAEKEKIEVSPQEAEEQISRFLQRYKNADDAKSHVDTEELREYTYGVIKNDKVFQFLEKL